MLNKASCKQYLLIITIIVFFSFVPVANPVKADNGVLWSKEYGGVEDDKLHASKLTSDNCLLLVGESNSFTEDHFEIYIVKIDLNGGVIWNITFGDSILTEDDAGYSVLEKSNAYFVTGKISHINGIGDDMFLLKISQKGKILWCRTYGGNAWDWGTDLVSIENGFLISGVTEEFWNSYYDVYLIKTDKSGKEYWKRRYSKPGHQYASDIISVGNGQYLILGTSTNVSNNESNIFLMKVDSMGNEIWFREYLGPGKEKATQIKSDHDNFLILGETRINDTKRKDIYLLKIDKNGETLWQKTIGGSYDELSSSLDINQNEILITGSKFNRDGNSSDQYILILNNDGKISFNETFGQTSYEKGILTHYVGNNTYYLTGIKHGKKPNITVSKLYFDLIPLKVITKYGDIYGTGKYLPNTVVKFGVKEEAVYIDNNTRYLFQGWNSSIKDAFYSKEKNAKIRVTEEIIQRAIWKKQYYVDIIKEGEGSIYPQAGWYDEGFIINIKAKPKRDTYFKEWRGIGNGSYTGINHSKNIQINNPITQKAVFIKTSLYELALRSEYGTVYGQGEYKENGPIFFGVTPAMLYFSRGERFVFTGWMDLISNQIYDTRRSITTSINRDLNLTARWRKQVYVNVTSIEDSVECYGSGWYFTDEPINISCRAPEGFVFKEWVGYGNGSYSGDKKNITISTGEPIIEVAKIRESRIYPIHILDETGNYNKTIAAYEGSNNMIPISKGYIYLSENIRIKFKGWKHLSLNKEFSKKNPIDFRVKEETYIKLLWDFEYLVNSSNEELCGWYENNSIIILPENDKHNIIPKRTTFYVYDNIVTNSVIVNEPLYIEEHTSFSYPHILLIGILLIAMPLAFICRKERLKDNTVKNYPKKVM